jgi:hypothetical protein
MVEATHRLGVLMLTSGPIEYGEALAKGSGGHCIRDGDIMKLQPTENSELLQVTLVKQRLLFSTTESRKGQLE